MLNPRQRQVLRGISKQPDAPLLTPARQKHAAALYHLGYLLWDRTTRSYRLTQQGLDAINAEVPHS